MLYEIRVDYLTGDSFGSERICGEDTGIVFDTYELAKEALLAIHEHAAVYSNEDKYNKEELKQQLYGKKWYELNEVLLSDGNHPPRSYDYVAYSWQYSIGVEISPGEFRTLSTSWNGYFECLKKATIHLVEIQGENIFDYE